MGLAKRIVKWTGIVAAILVLAAGGIAAYLYLQMPKPIGERPVLQAELFAKPQRELPVDSRFIYASAAELSGMIRARRATSTEIVQAHINYVKNNNFKTSAFVWLFEEDALRAARVADEKVSRGEPTGALHGVPVSVKEEFWIKGKPTTVNDEMFRGFKAPRNVAVVDALLEQGAIILGTTNVPKLLFDFQTSGEIYPTANNPYDAGRTPGGSTGGGAASVATGMCPIALGGDMGGSIRVPAAFCGIYGLKTTEGSMGEDYGPFGGRPGNPKYHRMAVAGPMARSVDDLDLAWNALMAKWPEHKQRMLEPKTNLADYTVAYFDEWKFGADKMFVGEDIKASLASLAGALRSKRVTVTSAQPPGFTQMLMMHRLLSVYLAFEKLPWLIRQFLVREYKSADKHRFDFSEALARMSDMDPRRYDDILERRKALTNDLESFFAKHDLLIMPVTSGPAIKHNPEHHPIALDGAQIHYWDYFYYPMCFNATGHPALTIPMGVNREGLPLALQVVGPLHSERRLISFARLIEPLHAGFVRPPH